MAVKGKSITILGAGIGGLTAAIALARRGARVTVLERAAKISEVGAGIQITPNATAVFAALDLEKRALRAATRLTAVELCDYRGGAPVMRLDMTAARHGNAHPYLLFHRADLIEMLAASAKRHGVDVQTGKDVSGVAIGFDQVSLPLADGTQRSGKILIGADGLHSLTRQAIEKSGAARFTGQVAWRALVRAEHVPAYDIPPVATIHMGRGRHLVTYPLRDGALINIVAVKEQKTWAEEGWNHLDDPQNLRREFADFSPYIKRLLSLCEHVHLWGLFAHPVAQQWSQGSAVILGDAAHPTLPFLAQGANMAIEDAWVLAEEMDRHDDLAQAFAAYEARRKSRTRRIVAAASGNSRIYHLSPTPLRLVAHQAMRLAERLAPAQVLGRYDWLYGHDVTAGAARGA